MTSENVTLCETPPAREGTAPAIHGRPPTDVYRTDDGWILEADLPGVASDKVSLDVDRGVLTLRAEAAPLGAGRPRHREFHPATYDRQYRLGDEIDAERVEAEMKNGVLRLRLPLAEAAKPRKIDIHVS